MNKEILCKQCGEPLQEGNIQTPRCNTMFWLPRGICFPAFLIAAKSRVLKKGGKSISSDSLLSVLEKKAYYCEKCNCVMIECDEIKKRK